MRDMRSRAASASTKEEEIYISMLTDKAVPLLSCWCLLELDLLHIFNVNVMCDLRPLLKGSANVVKKGSIFTSTLLVRSVA